MDRKTVDIYFPFLLSILNRPIENECNGCQGWAHNVIQNGQNMKNNSTFYMCWSIQFVDVDFDDLCTWLIWKLSMELMRFGNGEADKLSRIFMNPEWRTAFGSIRKFFEIFTMIRFPCESSSKSFESIKAIHCLKAQIFCGKSNRQPFYFDWRRQRKYQK